MKTLALLGPYAFMNGEPEWIGVLSDPLSRHSPTNKFIGRYAYMVLPIGKTLDFNYIHNSAKGISNNFVIVTNYNVLGNEDDGFARDQGVASWELNLAAMLDVLSPNAYELGFQNPNNPPGYNWAPYYFSPLVTAPNTGSAFGDAEAILHYRYWPSNAKNLASPQAFSSLFQDFPNNTFYANAIASNIDSYCLGVSLTNPFASVAQDSNSSGRPWPGSYTTNLFYNPQDLFDPTRTSTNFINRLLAAGAQSNFFDRYTFQRMLQCIGTGSSPEYGVFVYTNSTNLNPGTPPTWLRTKVNINYDNTAQIQNSNAPYAPMPTNLSTWAPVPFFSNAADLLLRSQEFPVANYIYVIGTSNGLPLYATNNAYLHFGITNIPVYNSTNGSIRYNAQIHRMLQLAANIYDATTIGPSTNVLPPAIANAPVVFVPHVFRPQFSVVLSNNGVVGTVTITNYVAVTNDWAAQIAKGFRFITDPIITHDLNLGRDDNIWGVPWVIGTVKGLPSFNQFTSVSSFGITRRLQFTRPSTNVPPQNMAQAYDVVVSNLFGAQFWNPYSNAFPRAVAYAVSNYVTISITNTNGPVYMSPPRVLANALVTNVVLWQTNIIPAGTWRGYTAGANSSGIQLPLVTNVISFPEAVYSEHNQQFFFLSNNFAIFAPADYRPWPKGPGWPIHSWVFNVTNYVTYYMFDTVSGRLLDFVNLGPVGTTLPIIQALTNGIRSGGFPVGGGSGPDTSTLVWDPTGATDSPNSPMSAGVLAQINIGRGLVSASDWPPAQVPSGASPTYWLDLQNKFNNDMNGKGNDTVISDPLTPTMIFVQVSSWQANDPLVHYTSDDLTWLQQTNTLQYVRPVNPNLTPGLNTYTFLGIRNPRYDPWPGSLGNQDMLLRDPGLVSVNYYDFPTNKFPSIGWLGRVHRGTPWQTVFFKADPTLGADTNTWFTQWVGNISTYPTNDYVLPDLFTAVPNDNAARGLLSINQTNDPAWAAVFAGLVVPTNAFNAATVAPGDVYSLLEAANGINATRATEPNGLFHHLGNLFRTPALSIQSPYLGSNGINAALYSDEVVERIPQEILGLLKVGNPQFVIYAWGQSLRPKSLYFGAGQNFQICTNYEITGEVLTRTVCHVKSDPNAVSPRIVVDSFNFEPGN